MGSALGMLRIGPLIVGSIKKKWLVKTPLDLINAEKPPVEKYGTVYPQDLLVFTIGSTYAVIAPLILPFATIFFALAYIVHRYQALYVNVPNFESGGSYWPPVFARCFVGLMVGQLTLTGLLSLKLVPIQAGISLILPFMTYFMYSRYSKLYYSKALTLPVELQVTADADAPDARQDNVVMVHMGPSAEGEDIAHKEELIAAGRGPFPSFLQPGLQAVPLEPRGSGSHQGSNDV